MAAGALVQRFMKVVAIGYEEDNPSRKFAAIASVNLFGNGDGEDSPEASKRTEIVFMDEGEIKRRIEKLQGSTSSLDGTKRELAVLRDALSYITSDQDMEAINQELERENIAVAQFVSTQGYMSPEAVVLKRIFPLEHAYSSNMDVPPLKFPGLNL